ncbi:hypothetical protein RvY_06467 [Ramazzottius varieornatus]|uniref:Secreted protein n=1 Tax=Ramazzottius varieornatus TaxID=947166 RepID=A0A1D1UYQ3_RAMVA|nr:hypothetical protein RvY_06467 [Ramazzottius varieornatus]
MLLTKLFLASLVVPAEGFSAIEASCSLMPALSLFSSLSPLYILQLYCSSCEAHVCSRVEEAETTFYTGAVLHRRYGCVRMKI